MKFIDQDTVQVTGQKTGKTYNVKYEDLTKLGISPKVAADAKNMYMFG